jgi:signal peptidase II
MVRNNALSWLGLSAVVVGLDQLSKAWVLATLPEFQQVPVIAGFWNWFRTYNTGAAFSFLSDAGGWQKYVFVALALVISIVLGRILSRTPRGEWRTAAPFALVIGGAIGNVIDRLVHGHVSWCERR